MGGKIISGTNGDGENILNYERYFSCEGSLPHYYLVPNTRGDRNSRVNGNFPKDLKHGKVSINEEVRKIPQASKQGLSEEMNKLYIEKALLSTNKLPFKKFLKNNVNRIIMTLFSFVGSLFPIMNSSRYAI